MQFRARTILVAGALAGLAAATPAPAQQYDQKLFSEMRWRCIGPFLAGPPLAIFAALQGHPYGPNSERGVFRWTNGGQSFEKLLYKDENVGAADLAFDPSNSNTIYAVLWAARVAPWEIRSGESFVAPGSGLYKSTDGGNTWRQLTKGLPSSDDGSLGRIGVTVAPSQPHRVYATVEAKKGAGAYRSDDAGESWSLINSDRRIGGRGPRAMGISVSPHHPDLIYLPHTTPS